ncbi:MAG TPA: hypothetical protein VGH20_06630 [Myxococcales bacterium]|jgi:hypothetical protein
MPTLVLLIAAIALPAAAQEQRPQQEPAAEQPPAAAQQQEQPAPQQNAPAGAAKPAEPSPALDFDLLGQPKPVTLVDDAALRRRRTLLNWHQAAGLGMLGIALANTVVGQLNYSDRFASGPSTGRYEMAHQITAVATVVAFTGTGLLAVFAPNPLPKTGGFDRTTIHKVAMYSAAGAMAAEAVLGIYTAGREGYLNQPTYATAHLALGYFTFAAISLGVGVIVF